MPRTLPNFLIVGAMRSGTTSLARYLGAHPEVFIAARKEIHFFDLHFDRGLAWYAHHFARAGGKRAVGEATPSYMYSERAVARMARVVPQARLITILRDPVDRAYSHYWLNRQGGRETLPFADAIAAELELEERGEPLVGRRRPYMRGGHYLGFLQALCRHFPRDALLVLILEDMRDRPHETFAAACRFLGVDDTFVPPNLGERINRFVAYRSMRLRYLARRLPRPLHRVVARLNVREAFYPPMDPATRTFLRERFTDDNAALAAWLGRDLAVWSR